MQSLAHLISTRSTSLNFFITPILCWILCCMLLKFQSSRHPWHSCSPEMMLIAVRRAPHQFPTPTRWLLNKLIKKAKKTALTMKTPQNDRFKGRVIRKVMRGKKQQKTHARKKDKKNSAKKKTEKSLVQAWANKISNPNYKIPYPN